jgi:uncharacterized Tic20 family protein
MASGSASGARDDRDRRLCVAAHASALAGLILPLGQILGPYLLLLHLPRDAAAPARAARQAIDFQLTVVLTVLLMVAVLVAVRGGYFYYLLFLPNLFGFGTAIWAATRASHERPVRYPTPLHLAERAGRAGPGSGPGRET